MPDANNHEDESTASWKGNVRWPGQHALLVKVRAPGKMGHDDALKNDFRLVLSMSGDTVGATPKMRIHPSLERALRHKDILKA